MSMTTFSALEEPRVEPVLMSLEQLDQRRGLRYLLDPEPAAGGGDLVDPDGEAGLDPLGLERAGEAESHAGRQHSAERKVEDEPLGRLDRDAEHAKHRAG